MGLRLNLKWGGFSVQSPLSASSPYFPVSYPCRCKDGSNLLARPSTASLIYREIEMFADTSLAESCSSSTQVSEKFFSGTREVLNKEDESAYLINLQATQATRASQFKLLMKNLDILEDMFADAYVARLEGDILKQLERLGALRYFHACLSRTLQSVLIEVVEEPSGNNSVTDHSRKVVFSSGKKELRKLRRKQASGKENGSSSQEFNLETASNDIKSSCLIKQRRSRNRKQQVAWNEEELSRSVKLVAELEKIRLMLEVETGEVATLSSWAEATGVKKKELLHNLHHGRHCMDQLVRSTRSLVLFIARNYRGLGVSLDDLMQAGKLGVLEGAERFDQSRGYKFSTYVQYWIRKSMSALIARHARGIRVPVCLVFYVVNYIPFNIFCAKFSNDGRKHDHSCCYIQYTLSKGINHIQKAQKYLSISNGKYPDDLEIAKFTGLSLAKVKSASECLRVVGSIDKKVGYGISIKFLEVTADASTTSPEEGVMRDRVVEDLHRLLNDLEPSEIQVLMLRFGLKNHQRKSLEEIGKLFGVSKEWIRKIEREALSKLRNDDCLKLLSHYVYMQ